MSRFSGAWVALKCVHDTVESTASIPVDLSGRGSCCRATTVRLPGGLNIRWPDNGLGQRMALAQEGTASPGHNRAARASARANGLDRVVLRQRGVLGVVTTGKSYLDLIAALDDLGIDDARARALGLLVYKVGMAWPLEPVTLERAVGGLERWSWSRRSAA